MTAIEYKRDALRWYNPGDERFSRTITDERLANLLRIASAVDSDIRKAIQSAQRSKARGLDLE